MIGRRTEFDALVSPPITASIGEVMLAVQYVNPPCNQVQEVLGRTECPRARLPRPTSPRLGAEVRPAACQPIAARFNFLSALPYPEGAFGRLNHPSQRDRLLSAFSTFAQRISTLTSFSRESPKANLPSTRIELSGTASSMAYGALVAGCGARGVCS